MYGLFEGLFIRNARSSLIRQVGVLTIVRSDLYSSNAVLPELMMPTMLHGKRVNDPVVHRCNRFLISIRHPRADNFFTDQFIRIGCHDRVYKCGIIFHWALNRWTLNDS